MSKVMFQAKVTSKHNHTHSGLFVIGMKRTRCDLPRELNKAAQDETDIKEINGIVGNVSLKKLTVNYNHFLYYFYSQ